VASAVVKVRMISGEIRAEKPGFYSFFDMGFAGNRGYPQFQSMAI
jgi:hypothetical protein